MPGLLDNARDSVGILGRPDSVCVQQHVYPVGFHAAGEFCRLDSMLSLRSCSSLADGGTRHYLNAGVSHIELLKLARGAARRLEALGVMKMRLCAMVEQKFVKMAGSDW